jgi:hypothetical protein
MGQRQSQALPDFLQQQHRHGGLPVQDDPRQKQEELFHLYRLESSKRHNKKQKLEF